MVLKFLAHKADKYLKENRQWKREKKACLSSYL